MEQQDDKIASGLRMKVSNLCANIAEKAQHVIKIRMPEKILALEKLHEVFTKITLS